MASQWKSFEIYVWWEYWVPEFPRWEGWDCGYQKQLVGKYFIDFAAWRGNDRAVGDAKDKYKLSNWDVGKLVDDAGIFKASRRMLFIAWDTYVPDSY